MEPRTPDYGHQYADKQLAALIKRMKISYHQASMSLQQKIENYLREFEKEDTMKRALYDSGELSHEAYMAWRSKAIAGTKQWAQMRERLAIDMTQQNKIAAAMISDSLPGVYALNHNYGTYEAEVASGIDTTYTLYDKSTVARLLKEKQDLLPAPSVNAAKDERWNKRHLQSAVLQGILTGEPMDSIAKRFLSVTDMSANAAIRNARTAVTGAENAGRVDSYKRAQAMGIKMKQVWIATLDNRTRASHAMMDGEQVEVGETFSNGCRYPGDPNGRPEEVINCRCTVAAVVESSDAYAGTSRPSQYLEDSGMSYDRWRELHGEQFYEKLFNSEMEHRAIGERGREICPKAIFNSITKAFRKNGGTLIRGEDAKSHAQATGSSAAYIAGGANTMYLLDDATITEVLEESYHYLQDMRHDYGYDVDERCRILREIDAQRYLQQVANKYKIPLEERNETALYLDQLLEDARKYGYV